MADRKALVLLVLIMTLSTIIVGGLVFAFLYRAELDRYRHDLVEAARHHAAELTAAGVAGLAPFALPRPDGPAIYRSLHETGRLLVGRLDRGRLVVAETTGTPVQADPSGSYAPAAVAELMQRALARHAGAATISIDRRPVLAAYEPVPGQPLGVVALVDVEEVRSPFIDAAAKAGGAAVLVIAATALLVFAIGNPILTRWRQGEARFSPTVREPAHGRGRLLGHRPGRRLRLHRLQPGCLAHRRPGPPRRHRPPAERDLSRGPHHRPARRPAPGRADGHARATSRSSTIATTAGPAGARATSTGFPPARSSASTRT